MQRCSLVAASLVVVCLSAAAGCLPRQTLSASPSRDELIILASHVGQTVDVRLGDTLRWRPPAAAPGWQIDFAADVLELLTPDDRAASPGPEGWRLRAVGSGETDLTITARPAAAAGQAAPQRFSVTVRVK